MQQCIVDSVLSGHLRHYGSTLLQDLLDDPDFECAAVLSLVHEGTELCLLDVAHLTYDAHAQR
jgi:hypothetical protein